ncbi:hypothetical protein K456DRAFT_595159 [Colletotrichum gloeosporioides 23]|nr:hypothetical protein K456DRAFT_595159 [Colletotrichum gloeosporioides 23]
MDTSHVVLFAKKAVGRHHVCMGAIHLLLFQGRISIIQESVLGQERDEGVKLTASCHSMSVFSRDRETLHCDARFEFWMPQLESETRMLISPTTRLQDIIIQPRQAPRVGSRQPPCLASKCHQRSISVGKPGTMPVPWNLSFYADKGGTLVRMRRHDCEIPTTRILRLRSTTRLSNQGVKNLPSEWSPAKPIARKWYPGGPAVSTPPMALQLDLHLENGHPGLRLADQSLVV